MDNADVLENLSIEIDRLMEEYRHSEIALEVLQAIQNWAMDESVPLAREII
jgi:hypothetical protein